jgi:hypothetical protein
MQVLKGPSKTVLNCSSFDEAILILMPYHKDDRLKPISHHHKNQLGGRID